MLALSMGCTAPTELVLEVDTDVQGADTITVTARAPGGEPQIAIADLALQPPPRTLVLRRASLAPSVRAQVEASSQGRALVAVDRDLTFEEGRSLRLRVFLADACRRIDCTPGTCGNDGRCRPIAVDACELEGRACSDAGADAN